MKKIALLLALVMLLGMLPLTAFAESLPEQEESILSDNFDELVRKAEEENKIAQELKIKAEEEAKSAQEAARAAQEAAKEALNKRSI